MSANPGSAQPSISANPDEFADIQQLLAEAAAHAHVGEDVPTAARMRPFKRAVVKALRPVTSFQRVYNTKILLAVTRLKDHFEAVARSEYGGPAQLSRLNVSLSTLDVALDHINDRVRELEARFDELEHNGGGADVRSRLERVDQLQDRLKLLETKQNVIFREARQNLGDAPDIEAMRTLAVELETDDAKLYADMEDLFRGSRQDVRSLLEHYLVDLDGIEPKGQVADIGCGRGEWLELLRDHGIDAYGLDLNPITVGDCVERGLDVRLVDAVEHLRGVPEGSLRAVTGFHIAEHLSLDGLLSVIESARLALAPGGMLILETPNCTNLSVGAASFYLDPTHVKPLHPQLLEFLCHHRGFTDVEVRFLHPKDASTTAPTLADDDPIAAEINWALFGPMDYAVIATK